MAFDAHGGQNPLASCMAMFGFVHSGVFGRLCTQFEAPCFPLCCVYASNWFAPTTLFYHDGGERDDTDKATECCCFKATMCTTLGKCGACPLLYVSASHFGAVSAYFNAGSSPCKSVLHTWFGPNTLHLQGKSKCPQFVWFGSWIGPIDVVYYEERVPIVCGLHPACMWGGGVQPNCFMQPAKGTPGYGGCPLIGLGYGWIGQTKFRYGGSGAAEPASSGGNGCCSEGEGCCGEGEGEEADLGGAAQRLYEPPVVTAGCGRAHATTAGTPPVANGAVSAVSMMSMGTQIPMPAVETAPAAPAVMHMSMEPHVAAVAADSGAVAAIPVQAETFNVIIPEGARDSVTTQIQHF